VTGAKLDPQDRKRILSMIRDDGPMDHEELSQEAGFEWDKTQQIIRDLRRDGLISITLDREYEISSEDDSQTSS